MKTEHEQWITDWLTNNGALENGGYSKCREASEDMAEAFPSLTVVKGHVHCPHPWGKRGHWWCKEMDGEIVDPTAKQFPFIYGYEEYIEGADILIGKCMNCGEEIWGPSPDAVYSTCLCSEECGQSFEAYLAQGGV